VARCDESVQRESHQQLGSVLAAATLTSGSGHSVKPDVREEYDRRPVESPSRSKGEEWGGVGGLGLDETWVLIGESS